MTNATYNINHLIGLLIPESTRWQNEDMPAETADNSHLKTESRRLSTGNGSKKISLKACPSDTFPKQAHIS